VAAPPDSSAPEWLCNKLMLQVSSLTAIRTRRFEATLARDSDGGVHLVRLVAAEPG